MTSLKVHCELGFAELQCIIRQQVKGMSISLLLYKQYCVGYFCDYVYLSSIEMLDTCIVPCNVLCHPIQANCRKVIKTYLYSLIVWL